MLWAILFLSVGAQADRPVYEAFHLSELTSRSNTIFYATPSEEKPFRSCAHELSRWEIKKVYKGDASLVGKVVSVAAHNYRIFAAYEGKMLPSYKAYRYKEGAFDKDQVSSILFTIAANDGCFELTADGAQEEYHAADLQVRAFAADPKNCDLLEQAFDQRAMAMPAACAVDGDCKRSYANPNACARPYVWNKLADDKMLDPDWVSLSNRVRGACASRWGKQPVCAPIIFPIHCQAGRCEEAESNVNKRSQFARAVMRNSCAPNDSASTIIEFTEKSGKAYPVFMVNLWGEKRPLVGGGDYELKSGSIGNDYVGSYCPSSGACALLKSFAITIHWQKDAKQGTVEYSVTNKEDETYTGTLSVEFEESKQPMICG